MPAHLLSRLQSSLQDAFGDGHRRPGGWRRPVAFGISVVVLPGVADAIHAQLQSNTALGELAGSALEPSDRSDLAG
jgi:hypothetical protein